MVTKTETTQQLMCDLCGRETNPDDSVTLYRSDNRVSAVKVAAAALLRPEQGGVSNVDICPACRQRPVQEVLALMYPPRA
jgi:hypothetical protein